MRHELESAPKWRAQSTLQRAKSMLVQPLVLAGIALIALTWVAAAIKINSEIDQAERQSIADARNYALLFEQDVLRTASELDRTIKYLRQNYERSNFASDWSLLLREEHTVNNRTVQIAIIDSTGGMITSSAMLKPTKRIDLSDREHFQVHARSKEDRLFISKPVLGRASNKWSIQFTRPFQNSDKSFGGVIVVSLDPEALISTYNRLDAFEGGSFILLGSDDIIRASAGRDRDQIGRPYREAIREVIEPDNTNGTQVFREQRDGEMRLAASRRVGKLPLEVIVSAPESYRNTVAREARSYIMAALGISLAITIGIIQAIRRQRSRYRQVTALAHTDILTGLHNRHSFQVILSDLFKTPVADRACALHLIDLDKFKAVNDTHGHHAGDMLLKAVAERLKGGVRSDDLVFRLGGDEFALLQTNCTTDAQAGTVATRLCRLIAEPFSIESQRLSIGASIGVVTRTDDLKTSESLLQAADMALYLAKSNGRGVHRFYDRAMDAALAHKRQLEAELSGAADRGELELHYQPKMRLLPNPHISGFEALVRWRHPVHGLMPPLEFIQLAEETGAIIRIGEWVLHQACHDIVASNPDWTVAVNCSAAQFARSDVHRVVAEALAATGLPPERLEIEITETMLMRNDQRTLSQLEQIRKLGVRISLDDFGTGFSSLSYLHTYPVDCIKVDRSFVKTIGTDRDAGPIIRAIVAMAAELRLTTVAEGVETQQQLAALQLYGCTAVQGYLFSPPKPAKDSLFAPPSPIQAKAA